MTAAVATVPATGGCCASWTAVTRAGLSDCWPVQGSSSRLSVPIRVISGLLGDGRSLGAIAVHFIGRYFGFSKASLGQPRLDLIAKKDLEVIVRLPDRCDTDAIRRASRPLKKAAGQSRAAWTEPHAFEQLVELRRRGAYEIHYDGNHRG